jgi:hypothetical protein
VASSPLPQHLPSEGPVRLSHLVPKTSLDGGDVALTRSGSAGVFDMTNIDAVLWDCGFPEAPRPVYKRGRGGRRVLNFIFPRSAKTLTAF